MIVFRTSRIAVAAFAAPLMLAGPPARAQIVFVQPATPDADALASEMRSLAANPNDVNAMVRAGELTLKLDDATAAAGFFARAERIDPSNPRIKAGKATILVQAGRPGEALRLFAEAEALRGDVRRFAADRGLAYDLIGEQERAQRDYRLALRDGPADETMRRYALSLGISGKPDEALLLIDPLLRRSDRAAWRTRAFILAMNGDSKGAERIAASMMPGGQGRGLHPFFARLPTLSPVDRAFAVHFGEVRVTPQRLADARLAPRLAALPSEPGRPAVTPRAQVAMAAAPVREDRRARRDREKREKQQSKTIRVATVLPPVPLPQPPAYQAPSDPAPTYQVATSQLPSYRPPAAVTPPYRATTSEAADRSSYPASSGRIASRSGAAGSAGQVEAFRPQPGQPLPSAVSAVTPYRPAMSDVPVRAVPPAASIAQVVTPRAIVVAVAPVPAAIVPAATIPAATIPAATIPAATVAVANPAPTTPTGGSAVPEFVSAAPVATLVPAEIAAATPPILPPVPGPSRGEDSILAKIIANITVPGSELDVAPVDPAPTAAAVVAQGETVAPVAADQRAADRIANEKAAAEAARLAERKLADARKAADAKKLADTKKIADAKKLAEEKKAAELKKKNDPKLLEPARIWVQVSGGANERDLPKEWARVRTKAPLAFKGRVGWTTPLKATNRVLTGPFKTEAEARSFVNALSKEGLSAFTFTSEAGQKVSKLAGK